MNPSTMNILKHIILYILISSIVWADVKVTDVSVKPRWPWNGLVDITYSIQCDEKDEDDQPKDVYLVFTGIDNVCNQRIAMKSLTGDGAKEAVKNGGPYMVTWNARQDYPKFNSTTFSVKIRALAGLGTYMVVDLSGGPNANSYPVRFTENLPDLSNDTCRTSELWLRRVEGGTFLMGTAQTEIGHESDETLHEVTLTQDYYIGVFECTQKQYWNIMGNNPSYNSGATCPVEQVAYNTIRGTPTAGVTGWPEYGHKVEASSFMGKLSAKTGLVFDLPTEAQWEFAVRGGNESKGYKYSGSNNVGDVAWYSSNANRSSVVGLKQPNELGLYDMSGNAWEWCLDWYKKDYDTTITEDPKGSSAGPERIRRGGSYKWAASSQRCANRFLPGCTDNINGFRIVCLPFE